MRSTPSRNRALARIAALLVALAVCACRDPYPRPRYRGAGATTAHYGGTFRWAVDSDVRSLDPHIGYDEYSNAGIRIIFDTLVDYLPGSTEIGPALAERWDVSPDGKTYTFHLRPGVRFHNGRVMTADDVRRSFERMLDPQRVPCPGTSFYHLIEGFDAFQEHRAPHLAGIVVPDPLTVQFRLTQADQTFLNAMAMPFAAPIAIEVAEALGRDGFSQAPVGTGPFMLERWELGARLVFRKNPHYWRTGRPYLDRIIMETSLARHLQFMRFQRGDLDHAHNLSMSTADYLWLREQRAWQPYVMNDVDISMYGVAMNTEMPPWNNVHLRRAVAFAIDREAIARSRSYRIRALGGVYPPGLPGYDPHLPDAQTFDLARARREMALAGYSGGLPEEQELWTTEGESGALYGQLLQADLRRIGIRLRLRQASFAVFLDTTQRRHAVGISLSAWSQDYPDPSTFIETLFHSRNIQPENSNNQSFYSNPELDALLDRARVEGDRAQRMDMYRRAEQTVVADAPWAFLFYPVRTEAIQAYVRNYRINPVFAHDFRDVWLDLPMQRMALWTVPGTRGGDPLAEANGLAAVLPATRPWSAP